MTTVAPEPEPISREAYLEAITTLLDSLDVKVPDVNRITWIRLEPDRLDVEWADSAWKQHTIRARVR